MAILSILITNICHNLGKPSHRYDTQSRFTLHFTTLGISFCQHVLILVSQPFAFPVLETIHLGHS